VVALRWNKPRVAMPMGQTKQKMLKPATAEPATVATTIPVEATLFRVINRAAGQREHELGLFALSLLFW
jgi:hypothetical protein